MPEHASRLPDGQPVLRVMPMPADVNAAGDIFGGWLMAQVDIAGGVAAMRRARGRVATVAVNSFQFKQPISVGDLVSFYADIIRVGHTSITVDVAVFSERHPAAPVVGDADLRGAGCGRGQTCGTAGSVNGATERVRWPGRRFAPCCRRAKP